MFSVCNILSASLLLLLLTPCIRAHPSQNNWEDKEDLEAFQKLLDQVDPPSLHEALHTFSPKKFKHGMFQEDRTAVEVIHKEEPSIATSIVNLARRQRREVVDLVKRANEISNGTTTTTPAAVNPQSTSTRVTPVPQRSDSSTPVGSTTETGVSSAGNSPITTTSTSASSNGTPVPGSTASSNGTPVPGSTASSNGTPVPGSTSLSNGTPVPGSTSSSNGTPVPGSTSSSNGTPIPGSTSPPTTSAQAAATTSGASPTSTSTGISVSLTAGQLVTTTNGVGLVVISTVGGGVSTVSPTGSMTSMAAQNAAAQTSVVVQTSTLPNGSKSVVTAVTVVGGSNPAADTPTGAAGVSSPTSASNPSLQTGEAVMTRGWGKEMVLVVGGAVVFAGMM